MLDEEDRIPYPFSLYMYNSCILIIFFTAEFATLHVDISSEQYSLTW